MTTTETKLIDKFLTEVETYDTLFTFQDTISEIVWTITVDIRKPDLYSRLRNALVTSFGLSAVIITELTYSRVSGLGSLEFTDDDGDDYSMTIFSTNLI